MDAPSPSTQELANLELRRMLDEMQKMLKLFDQLEHRHAGAVPASLELDGEDSSLVPLDDPKAGYGIGHFGPEHGLTPQQAWQAELLYRSKPPFLGKHAQQRNAARIRGLI